MNINLHKRILEYSPTAVDYIFDFDSTIAEIPINWIRARKDFKVFLNNHFPDLKIPPDLRVDEMEAIALRSYHSSHKTIFSFRQGLESQLQSKHVPIPPVIEAIKALANVAGKRLFILSNNLHETVVNALSHLGIKQAFTAIIGIDDVGLPKPHTRAMDLLVRDYAINPERTIFIGDNDRTDGGFAAGVGIPFLNIEHFIINSEN